MQKFLIIQTAFIGDVVLATGIAEKLHACFPEAQIDFLLKKGNEALLQGHPFLQEVLVWNKEHDKYRNLFKLAKTVRSRRYTKVINIHRYASTGFLTVFSKAAETIGFKKNPFSFLFSKKVAHNFKNGRHEIERNQELIAHFTDNRPARPKLYPTYRDKETIKQYQDKPYICVSPSSVWFTKQYPREKWVSFLDNLPSHYNYNIYLLDAPENRPFCEAIRKASRYPFIINLAGKINFLQSAALMQNALMNYVNDSAPMHFASAINAPVTAVFCSTNVASGYGPLSDKSFIVEVNEHLSCRPCGLHGYKKCPKKHFKCALDMEDRQLLETIPA